MPRNPVKLVDYNPDYSPQYCIKPEVLPDSTGSLTLSVENPWGQKFFFTKKTEISTGRSVHQELIHPHSRTTGPEFYVSNGIFIFSVLMLFALAGMRIFYGKAMWGLGKAVFNYQWAVKMYEEKNSLLERVYVTLDIIFLLNATLAIYFISHYFVKTPPFSVYIQLGIAAACVFFVYFSRVVAIWFVAGITKEVKKASEFLMVTNVFYKAAGMILFAPVILFGYVSEQAIPAMTILTISILAASYILTIIRGLYFSFKTKFYFYYYFLYLCAVEILPLLLTTKLFMLTNGI